MRASRVEFARWNFTTPFLSILAPINIDLYRGDGNVKSIVLNFSRLRKNISLICVKKKPVFDRCCLATLKISNFYDGWLERLENRRREPRSIYLFSNSRASILSRGVICSRITSAFSAKKWHRWPWSWNRFTSKISGLSLFFTTAAFQGWWEKSKSVSINVPFNPLTFATEYFETRDICKI